MPIYADPNYGQTTTPTSGGPSSLPPIPGSQLSAFGVNLTPPNPIQYAMPSNPGSISSVLQSVNTAQNQSNVANNERYKQLLAVLSQGAAGQQQSNTQAADLLNSNYGSALGSLSGSLGNNQTVFNNDQQRAISDAVKASSSAQQSGISRGLGNTTIMNSMQDQVQRAKNDALANVAAKKAEADNAVYSNIANIYQNKGNAASGLQERSGSSYMNNAGTIGNAIASRNDIGPSIGDYAGLIQGAAAAQNSAGTSTIRTTNPISVTGPAFSGGGSVSGGGPASISGGIASSTGAGSGWNSSGGSSGGGGTATSFGGGQSPISSQMGGQIGPPSPGYQSPQMAPVAPINIGTPSGSETNVAGDSGTKANGSPNTMQQGGSFSYGSDGWIGYKNPDGTWVIINPGNGGPGGPA